MRIGGLFPTAPKGKFPWQLRCNLKKYFKLCSDLIEKGEIYKRVLWEEKGVGSVSLLWLSPGAKIPKHAHLYDMELYIAWDKKKKRFVCKRCKKGDYHELENTSKQRWLLVISVKIDV